MPGEDRIAAAFRALEQERHALVRLAEAHDHGLLAIPPPNGGWSVAQVVGHLAMAERSALSYLDRKMTHDGHHPAGTMSILRQGVLRVALALPVRWRAPNIIADVPEMGWNEALELWEAARQVWREKLASLPPELATHELFKHPVAGKISLVRGLRFMADHVRHHRAQVSRTIRQLAR